MNKSQARAIASENGMTIMRDPVTSLATGYYLYSEHCVPSLDHYTANGPYTDLPCALQAEYYGSDSEGNDLGATYKLFCPASWFDLTGEV